MMSHQMGQYYKSINHLSIHYGSANEDEGKRFSLSNINNFITSEYMMAQPKKGFSLCNRNQPITSANLMT